MIRLMGYIHVRSLNDEIRQGLQKNNDYFYEPYITIAMAFRLKKTVKGNFCKYEALQNLQSGTGHAVLYRNPDTGVYYLNTYFYDKRYL